MISYLFLVAGVVIGFAFAAMFRSASIADEFELIHENERLQRELTEALTALGGRS